MGLVLVYEGKKIYWILDVFKWEVYKWEIDETDSGVGGGNRLHIRGGGGFDGRTMGMHEEDRNGEALLFVKEALG